MKITATFFDHKEKTLGLLNKTLNNVSKSIFGYLVIAISIALILFCASFVNISPNVLNFATNFRQASDKKTQISDLLQIYAFYNKSSYIFTTNINNIEKAKTENQDEYEMLDALAKDKLAQEVFSKTQKAMITDETKTLQRVSIGTLKILNYSSKRNIDFDNMLQGTVTLTKKSDKVLLYNTHTSESYTNSEKYKFQYDGIMRSRNAEFNMLAIAKELSSSLNSKGIECIQNTTPHDYGTYTSAYSKSRTTIKDALKNMGSAGIIIDVHRDASSNLEFAPMANINGVQVAQLMFVMGVGSDTSKNPYYEENLKLAIKIQQLADEIYPGLFRPMMIRDSVYNQDMNKFSLLVEVGATGNTIDQTKLSTRCLANLLNIIYKD